MRTFSSKRKKDASILDNLMFNFKRIIKEKYLKVVGHSSQYNELVVNYLEISLTFIVNDTDRQF